MNSNEQNIWPDPSRRDNPALQESLEVLIDEVEAYPLTKDRIAAIVAKADLIVRQTSGKANADAAHENNPLSAIQSLQTPESQSDLNRVLDEATPMPLEQERILRIVQIAQENLGIEEGVEGSNDSLNQANTAPTSPNESRRPVIQPVDRPMKDSATAEENPAIYRFVLWLKRHRVSAAVAAVAAVIFPLLSVVLLTGEVPGGLGLNRARQTTNTWEYRGLRGSESQFQSPTVMLDGTTSYPQAHGWLVWDEGIERWRFYAAGLKPTNDTDVYRIWLHRADSSENTSGHTAGVENSSRTDTSIVANHTTADQIKFLAIGTFEVQDPTEPVDLLLDLGTPAEIRKMFGQYWISVTHEPKSGGPRPTGTIVMVGQASPVTLQSGEDLDQ